MGFLKRLFGLAPGKTDLIKALVKKRVRDDPYAKLLVADPSREIDKMSTFELMGLPEGTIVSIVDTYSLLKSHGVPERDILERIEAHRSRFGDRGILPTPLTLSSYIKYRINLEHSGPLSFHISDEFIYEAIQEALRFFSHS